jgi:hypothetical protein
VSGFLTARRGFEGSMEAGLGWGMGVLCNQCIYFVGGLKLMPMFLAHTQKMKFKCLACVFALRFHTIAKVTEHTHSTSSGVV